jgi:hypothetical protein
MAIDTPLTFRSFVVIAFACCPLLTTFLQALASTHHVMPPFSNPIHPPNCQLSITPICNPSIINWKKFYSTTQMATTRIHPIHLWHKKYLVHLVIMSSPSEIHPNTYVHVNHWTYYYHMYSNTHPNFNLLPSYNIQRLDFQSQYPRGLPHRFSTTTLTYSHLIKLCHVQYKKFFDSPSISWHENPLTQHDIMYS